MDQLITRLALLWRAVSANTMLFVAVILSISFFFFVYRESREEKKVIEFDKRSGSTFFLYLRGVFCAKRGKKVLSMYEPWDVCSDFGWSTLVSRWDGLVVTFFFVVHGFLFCNCSLLCSPFLSFCCIAAFCMFGVDLQFSVHQWLFFSPSSRLFFYFNTLLSWKRLR